jgi:hypothetical protein
MNAALNIHDHSPADASAPSNACAFISIHLGFTYLVLRHRPFVIQNLNFNY